MVHYNFNQLSVVSGEFFLNQKLVIRQKSNTQTAVDRVEGILMFIYLLFRSKRKRAFHKLFTYSRFEVTLSKEFQRPSFS